MITFNSIDRTTNAIDDAQLTPRDLINYRMLHPEKMINDEDIENLLVGNRAWQKIINGKPLEIVSSL